MKERYEKMGRERILFKAEERKGLAEVAEFLRSLADRLEGGAVTLKGGSGDLEILLPGTVVLEVKVEAEEKRGGIKRSLEVEIEWREGDDASSGGVSLA